MEKKAVIAMSGGVDSSVAALLVQQFGYEAIGVTLKLHTNEDAGFPERKPAAPGRCERRPQRSRRLGMPFYVFNFTDSFRQEVMDRFVRAYERGETPNPCIDCNRYIKFRKLMQRAREIGYDYVATGHYAWVEQDVETGRWLLKKAWITPKTKAMCSIPDAGRAFPPASSLGGLTKERVRQIAEENGFVNAKKHDSQDICFVPDGDYAAFIERYAGTKFQPGPFVGTHGEVYGEHRGIIHYTVGQRKGLGLSFPSPCMSAASIQRATKWYWESTRSCFPGN